MLKLFLSESMEWVGFSSKELSEDYFREALFRSLLESGRSLNPTKKSLLSLAILYRIEANQSRFPKVFHPQASA